MEGCPVVLHSLSAYDAHYQHYHTFKCEVCGLQLPNNRLLEMHLAERHDELFRCMAKTRRMVSGKSGGRTIELRRDGSRCARSAHPVLNICIPAMRSCTCALCAVPMSGGRLSAEEQHAQGAPAAPRGQTRIPAQLHIRSAVRFTMAHADVNSRSSQLRRILMCSSNHSLIAALRASPGRSQNPSRPHQIHSRASQGETAASRRRDEVSMLGAFCSSRGKETGTVRFSEDGAHCCVGRSS
jgi:hypothetical protein